MGNGREVNPGIFSRYWLRLARTAVCFGGLVLFAMEARAVTLTLEMTNITTFAGQTFQMPLTASDPDGHPLKFSATVSNKKAVTAAFAPSSNPSLVLNVSGIDSNNQPFTGDIELQLFNDLVPHTTARIIDLVNSNFYNGLLFRRVILGFVAQGGASTNDDNFGSGVTFQDEYSAELTYTGFGQLGMANSSSVFDSDDSQFFITDGTLSLGNPSNSPPVSLNFQNGIFGQVTRGFDVLSDILGTPVVFNPNNNEVSAPLSNVFINSATIITNSQDGVLRLTASRGFTGQVAVAVSAINAEKQSITQMLQVNVIIDTNNTPPFLGLIPASIVLTQNTSATFITTNVDIDGDHTFLGTGYADSPLTTLTNIVPTFDPKTGQIWLDPDVTVTGVVTVLIGVQDQFHGALNFSLHKTALTFLPRSATPTMSITSLKGMLMDSGKPGGDSVNVSGKFAFVGQSDRVFSSLDDISLTVGDPTNPVAVAVGPGNAGWKFHSGTVSAKALASFGANTNVSLAVQFNGKSHSFKISLKNFDFPVAISNQVQIGIAVGNDYVTDVRTWVETAPGIFMPPP